MREKDQEHKSQLRMFGIAQYLAGTQHIRFEPIGSDTRGNKYWILSETPARAYPTDRSTLAWSWSFSLIMHGSPPNNDKVPKTARPIKKDGSALAPPSAPSSEADIDMLEGGDREENDQWVRVSEPHEIRQLANWIGYEAALDDHQRETSQAGDGNDDDDLTSSAKAVAGLVERCQAFAEFVDLRVSEAETSERAAAVKGRTRGAGML